MEKIFVKIWLVVSRVGKFPDLERYFSKFENLIIKILKCKNSEFDDNPEVTAYMQVQDITLKNNDKVFVFNGWTFSSSPSISLFDHPIYDIWLIKCY